MNSLGIDFIFTNSKNNEIEWFHSLCWNNGLKSIESEKMEIGYQFFKLSSQFLGHLECNTRNMSFKLMGYVNRIHCLFKLGSRDKEKENDLLNIMLIDIEESKMIYNKINEMKRFNELPKEFESKSIISILLVSEFKCKVLLNYSDQNLKFIFDLCEKECLGPKIFLTLSQIVNEKDKKRLDISKEALKRSLHLLIHESPLNINLCLSVYIKLIEISPNRDSSFSYYEDSLQLLKSNNIQACSKSDIKFLIVESWNHGIYYFKCNKFVKSEEWMKISLSISNYLDNNDELRVEISNSYPLILSKINDQKLQDLKKK